MKAVHQRRSDIVSAINLKRSRTPSEVLVIQLGPERVHFLRRAPSTFDQLVVYFRSDGYGRPLDGWLSPRIHGARIIDRAGGIVREWRPTIEPPAGAIIESASAAADIATLERWMRALPAPAG